MPSNDHLGTWTYDLAHDMNARLDLWDTGRTDSYGKSELRYALAFIPEPASDLSRRVVIIEGEDYHPSPLIAIDSDESAGGLIGFMSYYGETSEPDALEDFTESQIETLRRYSDELSLWALDLEEGKPIEETAREAYGWFETARRETTTSSADGRDDTTEAYTRLRDGAPEWLRDLIRSAHGDFLPDDWRYDCIRAAIGAIANDGLDDDSPHEFADSYTSVYNCDLATWLESNGRRGAYVDDAVEEYGYPTDRGIYGAIGLGQYAEALEVFSSVADSLREVSQ